MANSVKRFERSNGLDTALKTTFFIRRSQFQHVPFGRRFCEVTAVQLSNAFSFSE